MAVLQITHGILAVPGLEASQSRVFCHAESHSIPSWPHYQCPVPRPGTKRTRIIIINTGCIINWGVHREWLEDINVFKLCHRHM